MKNYLSFNASVRRLSSPVIGMVICLWAYLFFCCWWHLSLQHSLAQGISPSPLFQGSYALGIGVYYFALWLLTFPLLRTYLSGIAFRNTPIAPHFRWKPYLWLLTKGALLTLITLGVYMPWFECKLIRFFSGNTFYRDKAFRFEGKGITLFCLYTFILLLPYLLLILLGVFTWKVAVLSGSILFIALTPLFGVAILLLIALFLYLYLKWLVDFTYEGSRVRLQSNGFSSLLLLFIQITLTIFTLGLYLPAAQFVIYRLVVRHTHIFSAEEQLVGKSGYSGPFGGDLLYFYGQFLLMLATLGVYAPWAIVRISRRLLSHTYLELPDDTATTPSTPTAPLSGNGTPDDSTQPQTGASGLG